MKDLFIRLFNYDRYANQLIAETVLSIGTDDKAVAVMAHLLAVQQIWLGRCKNESAAIEMWPDWDIATIQQVMVDNHRAWVNILDYLSPDDFEQIMIYKNLAGKMLENKLSDILMHVINHGTHHRAQAGQHLKAAGATLPLTDYILYLWTGGL